MSKTENCIYHHENAWYTILRSFWFTNITSFHLGCILFIINPGVFPPNHSNFFPGTLIQSGHRKCAKCNKRCLNMIQLHRIGHKLIVSSFWNDMECVLIFVEQNNFVAYGQRWMSIFSNVAWRCRIREIVEKV